jgi:4-diphosphocytidyl-2C-methyl-D-erythritol kinase
MAHRVCHRVAKRIPIGAGLGGGSADAGAGRLRASRLTAAIGSALLEIAAALGADVPFMTIDDRWHSAPDAAAISPHLRSSHDDAARRARVRDRDSDAYAWLDADRSSRQTHRSRSRSRAAGDVDDAAAAAHTTTSRIVARRHPDIGAITDRLDAGACIALLAGSMDRPYLASSMVFPTRRPSDSMPACA